MTGSVAVSGVSSEAHGGAGLIVISNPAKKNALSVAMMSELGKALRRLDADPDVRVIVLRGAGTEAFASGADISEFEARQTSEEIGRSADETVDEVFATMDALTTPLIAMIHGYCLGAGMALALGADLRIAAEGSSFAIPAARLGLGYPLSLTHSLVDAVGAAHASDILFTGRRFTDREALTAGLVNRLVAPEELQDTVDRITSAISANAPLSVRAAKAAIKARTHLELLPTAQERIAAARASDDVREGQRAFMQRRPPEFRGR